MRYIIDLKTFDFDIKRFQRRVFNYGFKWISSKRKIKENLGEDFGWDYLIMNSITKNMSYERESDLPSLPRIITASQFLKDLDGGKIRI